MSSVVDKIKKFYSRQQNKVASDVGSNDGGDYFIEN